MDTATAGIGNSGAISAKARMSSYFELTKPRIAFMLVLTSAAGFYLGTNGAFNWLLFLNAMAAITLLAFGVATLNQYIERAIDGLMDRTAGRPLPAKKISPVEALVFGSVLCVAAELYLLFAVNALTAILGLSVIVGYVFVYTPLKTRTTLSTAIGAIPGAMPPLMGWTAAANEITLGAWILFVLLYLWQFPHFLAIAWLYREEYSKAGIKMLPAVERSGRVTVTQIVIFTLLMLPISIGPFFVGVSGWIFLAGASLLGVWFLWASLKMARQPDKKSARRLLLTSVLYLPLMFALMVFNH
ncbi:MAG: protoheme IX farnesyltransferase [Acidobacteria bacterium]|nr:MAG: protoheme IX farnesyltransferase [Acidobacteriota bacterium]REK01354.1 MAG: protoheme IX farnesyltransferase [Acidobacteriota bacterium]REK14310.1 MAG: protoheme IX farnesyltransferase [Acidobacteriota bacterium]REK45025.1 MAG: protoheme IX farnesyltransferase [Acidobacteriota bacterium]